MTTRMIVAVTLTAMFGAAQPVAAGASTTGAQQTPARQREETLERVRQQAEQAKARLDALRRQLELATRVRRATGALLSADRIEATADGVSAQGHVRITFSGGAIAAEAVVIEDGGVVRVLGDSEVTITPR